MTKTSVFIEAHLTYLLAGLLLCVMIFHFAFPEYIQEENGLGWDGEAYASILKNFKQQIQNREINSYYFQRIFPIAIVYGELFITGLPLSDTNIIRAFLAFNIVLIGIAFWAWVVLCQQLQLRTQGKVLSFSGIFINYALLKMPFYYPVLTDLIAFSIGLLMFYCSLRKYKVGLLFLSVIGAFSFPTLFYCGMLLYVLPVQNGLNSTENSLRQWNKWLAILGVILFTVVFIVARFIKDKPYVNPPDNLIFAISSILAIIYVYFIIYKLTRIDWYLQELFNAQTWKRAAIAILLFAIIYVFTSFLSSSEEPILNYKGFLANVVIEAITNPLVFLVAHFVYFGPVFLLALYFGKDFIRQVNTYGTGLHAFVLLYLLLGAGSESRQFINAWPVFVLILCVALEKYTFPRLFLIAIVIFSLLVSKFWYRINTETFGGDFLDFPYQQYFMSQGPWMSDTMYIVQGSIALAIFGSLYFLFLRQKNFNHAQTTNDR
ncbi:hypothetical protein GXP67_23285 [Rhodocytophaga rosea]|uniref:DUF2029 domain-containing protein n=1 Tax=Rhodocytophaga rosea TaxID=2704465 RepID=A0A6C0GP02_9BACT|nr:hypothetical protein [Rhodocytophaga rosea]QHT69353.1 hypothetical protein GXP67_23285 [Rhodocytophaga rosea]